MSHIRPHSILAMLTAMSVSWLPGLACRHEPADISDSPDLVLLLTPGLRADFAHKENAEAGYLESLSEASPNLHFIRRYVNAYAQSTATMVSLASLLTGRYPSAIPICGLVTPETIEDSLVEQPWCSSLPRQRRSLPDILEIYGYSTALFSSHVVGIEGIASRFGYHASYGSGDDLDWRTDWGWLQEEASSWWGEHADQPRFLVLLLSDMEVQRRPDMRQALKLPPPEFHSDLPLMTVRPPRREDLAWQRPTGQPADGNKQDNPRAAGPQSGVPTIPDRSASPAPGSAQRPPELRSADGMPSRPLMQADDAAHPLVTYQQVAPAGSGPNQGPNANTVADSCLAIPGQESIPSTLDGPRFPWKDLDHGKVLAEYRRAAADLGQALAAMLDDLEPRPGRPRIVVATSTHGISIGETWGTGPFPRIFAWSDIVHERTIHVPLLFAGDGTDGLPQDREGAVEQEQIVELVDVLPTLLTIAGAKAPAGLPGQNLLGPEPPHDPQAIAYAEYGDMLALRRGPWLLSLRALLHNGTSLDPSLTEYLLKPSPTGGYKLHDVTRDPYQRHDRMREYPELAQELKQLMVRQRTGPGAPPEYVDYEKLWELRLTPSSGYW